MSTGIKRQQLEQWVAKAIEQFKVQDLLGVSDSWLKIYDALVDYLCEDRAADNTLLWMIEGADEALADVVYQLQRLKNALVNQFLADGQSDAVSGLLAWFDRLTLTLVEKDSGTMSKERLLSKPYETIFWNARDGMYISTVGGKFLHCNEAMLTMLDYESLDDVLAMNIAVDLYVDGDERRVMLEHLMKDGFFDHHEVRFRTRTGDKGIALESCYMVNETGAQYIVGIMVDITREKMEEHKAEQYIKGIERNAMETLLSLRRKNRRFEALMQLNDHPVVLVSPQDFLVQDANRAMIKRFRLKGHPLQSYALRDFFDKETWMGIYDAISESVHRHHFHIRDIDCRPIEGESFAADLSIWIHEDDQGVVLFVQIEDRSEIRNIKELLNQARGNLDTVIEAMPVGIMGFKADGQVATFNKYLQSLTGYTPKQLRNKAFLNRLFAMDEQRLKFDKYIRRFLNGNHARGAEVDLKTRSGEILHFQLSTFPFLFEAEDKIGFVAVLENVSVQRMLESLRAARELDPANAVASMVQYEQQARLAEDLLEKERRRSAFLKRFIEVVTERFKAPIHVVLGYASLLRKDLAQELKPGQLEDMLIVENQIGNVLEMLEKAIEFMRVEIGLIKPQADVVGVRALLDELFDRLRERFAGQHDALSLEHQLLSRELQVSVDKHLLESMLQHILDNAVAHTKQGRITLTAYEERHKLWIEIVDQGEGISPAEIPHLCEPFFLCSGDNQAANHLGLGFAIVQKYADLTGISLEISSRPGEGTQVLLGLGDIEG